MEQDEKGDETLQVHFNITRFVHPSWQIVINFYISFITWIFKARVDRIQTDLDELVKSLNERCKKYGLRAKPTTLLELPFGKFKFVFDFIILLYPSGCSQIFVMSITSFYCV